MFNSILGISWFWFLGSAYLAQLPGFTRYHLGGDSGVYTMLLATFSIGIGAGSLLCERLSGGRIEIGLVPLGAIGLTVFGIDLYFAGEIAPGDELRSVPARLPHVARGPARGIGAGPRRSRPDARCGTHPAQCLDDLSACELARVVRARASVSESRRPEE